MAKIVFKSYNQNDNLLFPPCLGDFIAANDPVRVLNAVVDQLDIHGIEDSYAGGGASSYHPRMLVKVVFTPISRTSILVGRWRSSSAVM